MLDVTSAGASVPCSDEHPPWEVEELGGSWGRPEGPWNGLARKDLSRSSQLMLLFNERLAEHLRRAGPYLSGWGGQYYDETSSVSKLAVQWGRQIVSSQKINKEDCNHETDYKGRKPPVKSGRGIGERGSFRGVGRGRHRRGPWRC